MEQSYSKEQFARDITRFLIAPKQRNEAELYSCGNCAAFPCHRQTRQDEPAGLCFQPVRQCRQECPNYQYEGSMPALGGRCKLDSNAVAYCDECHIDSIKKSKL